MRTLTVNGNQSGRRIDRVLGEVFPSMPVNALFKAFRKRNVKVNGLRVKADFTVSKGDKIEIFVVDDILFGTPLDDGNSHGKGFEIVYEDENILVVNKSQGIPVHPDRDQSSGTLIDNIRNYLELKGEYMPCAPDSFAPSLCHRLDRNTGGLVLIAKNPESLEILLAKIKNREIRKYYQCIVSGRMAKSSAQLKAYLAKDKSKSRVFVYDRPMRNSQEIITKYSVISYDGGTDTSRLKIELVTGRTHQIRAHLAHIGHPVIGDGKYGSNMVNRRFGAKYQALWAYRLVFDFDDAGRLSYLGRKKFEVEPAFAIKSAKD